MSKEALLKIARENLKVAREQWLCTDNATNNYTYRTPPMSKPSTPFRFLSCCSGIEAASVAWEPLGWEPAGYSEIDPFASAVLSEGGRGNHTPPEQDLPHGDGVAQQGTQQHE